MTDNNIPLSRRLIDVEFKRVNAVDGLTPVKGYRVEEVDEFLTEVSQEMKGLEETTARLYHHYKNTKNQNVEQEEDMSIPEATVQVPDNRIDKMQRHMNELLMLAESRAEKVVLDANVEAKAIIERAKEQAKGIIGEAQNKSALIEKQSEEKMKTIVNARREIEARSLEIKEEMERKAREVEKMGTDFGQMGQDLRRLINDNGEQNKTA